MRTRSTIPPCLVAIALLAGCQGSGVTNKSDGAGGTVWTIDWGNDEADLESDDVHFSLETADPLAGDIQFKQVTNLGPTSWLLGFDVKPDPENPELLMSILERTQGRRGQGYANVWIARVDNALDQKTRVTDGLHLDLTPTYVPNEDAILFSTDRFGSLAICKKQLHGGGGMQVISSQATQDLDPQVDSETGQLLYTQVREASANGILWVRPLTGGSPTQVGEGSEARWSPDGKRLLYSAVNAGSGKSHIWIRNVEGGQPTEVTTGDQNDINPCWSPDGNRIVFASDRATTAAEGEPQYDIWLINADGSDDPRQLTGNDSLDDNPRWLDSETILFRSNRGDEWNVWSLKLSQTGVE